MQREWVGYTLITTGTKKWGRSGQAQTTFAYNTLGRIETNTDLYGFDVSCGYDELGRRNELTYPLEPVDNSQDFTVQYEFDNLNRLSTIKLRETTLATYTYDDLNRRAQITYCNGTNTVYDYEDRYTSVDDDMGMEIESMTHTCTNKTLSVAYTYNKVGYMLTCTRNSSSAYDKYDYDALYQLWHVGYNWNPSTQAAELAVEYSFDDLGNRLSVLYGAMTETYAFDEYNQLNQYESVTYDSQTRQMDYDLNGNVIQYDDRTFTYDYLNRMRTAVVGSTHNESYEYDSMGRRVLVDADGTQTVYVYDGAQVIAEYSLVSQTLTLQKRFIYGPGIDEPVCMIVYAGGSESGRYFYHFDGQGNVVAMSDSSGNVVEEYEYNVYGSVTIYDGYGYEIGSSAVGNPYLFTGRRWDADTGLYYYRARMYSPALGRFLQPDPIGYIEGMNLYAYCGNNPLNFIDPWGLCGTESANDPGLDLIIDEATGPVKKEIKEKIAKELLKRIPNLRSTRYAPTELRKLRRIKNKLYRIRNLLTPDWTDLLLWYTDGTKMSASETLFTCPVCLRTGCYFCCPNCGWSRGDDVEEFRYWYNIGNGYHDYRHISN